MPIIDVTLLEGRPLERKAALIRELTDAAERVLGVPRESIRVLLRELPAAHSARARAGAAHAGPRRGRRGAARGAGFLREVTGPRR